MIDRIEMLKERLDCLKETFFVNTNENGELTHSERDKIKALRLLVHAEIESYIEDLAKQIFEYGVNKWKNENLATFQICALFIWHPDIETKKDVHTKANQIFIKYRKNILGQNNGIKEENIKKLFHPLGYKIDTFSPEFIATLNSYGAERGEVAHSSAIAIQTQLDYQTEVDKINALIEGLERFEEDLNNFQNAT